MYIVAIAWIYVVLMMAVAEALAPNGSLLGAFFTLLLYGALPLSIVLYILGTPARRRARRAAEAAAAAASAPEPDGGGHATGRAVAPERKET
jgi:membrane protein implicated in regulation of membrane protease activity